MERLTKHNDEMSFIQNGQNYPGLTQQIAVDLSSVTRKISGRELTDGNKEAKRSDLVNDMQPRLLCEVNEIAQLIGLVSWNQLLENSAISQSKLDHILREVRG